MAHISQKFKIPNLHLSFLLQANLLIVVPFWQPFFIFFFLVPFCSNVARILVFLQERCFRLCYWFLHSPSMCWCLRKSSSGLLFSGHRWCFVVFRHHLWHFLVAVTTISIGMFPFVCDHWHPSLEPSRYTWSLRLWVHLSLCFCYAGFFVVKK